MSTTKYYNYVVYNKQGVFQGHITAQNLKDAKRLARRDYGGQAYTVVKSTLNNPGSLISKLKRGIRGTIKIVGTGRSKRLVIKT